MKEIKRKYKRKSLPLKCFCVFNLKKVYADEVPFSTILSFWHTTLTSFPIIQRKRIVWVRTWLNKNLSEGYKTLIYVLRMNLMLSLVFYSAFAAFFGIFSFIQRFPISRYQAFYCHLRITIMSVFMWTYMNVK